LLSVGAEAALGEVCGQRIGFCNRGCKLKKGPKSHSVRLAGRELIFTTVVVKFKKRPNRKRIGFCHRGDKVQKRTKSHSVLNPDA
jgi:hypothetical protein